jgi:subtilisin family serine protease
MRRVLAIGAAVLLLAGAVMHSSAAPAAAATEEGSVGTPTNPENIIQDEVLVRFKTEWPEKPVRESFAARHGLHEIQADPDTDWFRYKITDKESAPGKMKHLRSVGEIAEVAPNIKIQLEWTPSDEFYGKQWYLPKVSMPAAWDAARGGLAYPNFIAVIDSGAGDPAIVTGPTTGGPELGSFRIGSTWYGANFSGIRTDGYDASDFGDCYGHGSYVASIAAATAGNGGMAGVAFNTGIMPVKFANCWGSGNAYEASRAIEWALNTHHVAVINCSFKAEASDPDLPSLQKAVDDAWAANVPVVAAAGNDGTSNFNDVAPARWYHAIAVGATGYSGADDDKRALAVAGTQKKCTVDPYSGRMICTYWAEGESFSNYGEPGLDVSAPGKDILGLLIPNNNLAGGSEPLAPEFTSKTGKTVGLGYRAKGLSGTSAAAPIVTGTISLMLQRHPGLTSSQVKKAIWNSADKVGGYSYKWKSTCGGQSAELGCGRLNAAKAVKYYG